MQTEVVAVDPIRPDAAIIGRAAGILKQGGLVAFPTETVYGLGANALDEQAVCSIFAAKGRPATNPLIVHVASIDEAKALALEWPDAAEQLALEFWPGPLTLVVHRAPHVPSIVTAGGPTVAIRIPSHSVAVALLKAAGVPLAAPSANRSSRLSPTLARHVLQDLNGKIALILDAGPTPGGLESTVVDVTCSPPRLLRPGPISGEDLQNVVGFVWMSVEETEGPLRSPGLQTRHYAPRAPLECCADGTRRVEELTKQGVKVGWLRIGAGDKDMPMIRTLPAEPKEYARRLYAVLHELDDAGVDQIVIDLPPATPEWFAVRDRLQRASA